MTINRIIVPVDFSDLSIKGLEVAQKVARLFEATITPVHVHIPISEMDEPYSLGMSNSIYQDLDKIEDNLKNRLNEISREHIEPDHRSDPVVIFGNPAQMIINLSDEYDLIVMTSHGRTGFSRFFMGSVAEKVLRLAPVPVIVVEDESDPGNFERILITTDFSDNSEAVFPFAVEIAKRAGSKVHLLHVLSFEQFNAEETDMSIEALRYERLKIIANKNFHEVKKNFTYNVEVSHDSPHEAILRHVRQFDYNLILMATLGRTGINYLMMGSTTTNVVRHVKTAVFSVNPRTAELKTPET